MWPWTFPHKSKHMLRYMPISSITIKPNRLCIWILSLYSFIVYEWTNKKDYRQHFDTYFTLLETILETPSRRNPVRNTLRHTQFEVYSQCWLTRLMVFYWVLLKPFSYPNPIPHQSGRLNGNYLLFFFKINIEKHLRNKFRLYCHIAHISHLYSYLSSVVM